MDRLTKKDFKFDMLNIINGRNKYCEIDDIMKALQSYEDTGLTPEEIEQLKTENAELRELLGLAFKDLTRACTYSPCNSGICLTSECKGNIMPCNFKWRHSDRLNKIIGGDAE